MQDSIGFIWFGTNGGLNRFDGRSFRTYVVSRTDTISLGDNRIKSMIEYKKHHFLVGTESGLYQFDMEADVFARFNKQTGCGTGIYGEVVSLLYDHSGNIWIASRGQGIFMYDPVNKHLNLFEHHPDDPTSISSNNTSTVYLDKQGIIWLGTTEGAIDRYNAPTKDFIRVFPAEADHHQTNNTIQCFYEDSKNNLWFGSKQGGLFRYDRGSGNTEQFDFQVQNERQGINNIMVIHEYDDQRLLVGTEEGLILFDPALLTYAVYTYRPNESNSLSDNIIQSIHQDREGSFWIGTRYGGVDLLPKNLKRVAHLFPVNSDHSIKARIITEFTEDRQGNLWVGTEDQGLFYYNPQSKEFDHFPAGDLPNSISHHNVQTVLLQDNILWIGLLGKGIDMLNTETGTMIRNFRAAANDTNSIPHNQVHKIYKDRSGTLWIGTGKGLATYQPEHDHFTHVKVTGIQDAVIQDILQDAFGYVWFGTAGSGIFRYDPTTGQWTHYLNKPGDPLSAFSNHINCIYQDKDGILWFGSEDARIFYYDYTSDVFSTDAYLSNHLISDAVLFILNDEIGNLWIGSFSGLYRYNPSVEKLLYVFQQSDGFQSSQFNYKSAFLASGGKLYFGGINGFNAFYPSDIELNTIKPTTVITSIRLFNEEIDIHARNSPMSKASIFTNSLVLNHRQSVIGIEFASLSYILPEKNRYSYMLEGHDKDWIFIHNNNEITFSYLEPGQYTLYLITSNNDGVYNEDPTKLSITVLPPFWKTRWAYVAYVFLIGISLYLFAVYMNKVADRKNKTRIIELNMQKEKEIAELKIDFFTHIAHEIKTPLMLINGPIEKLISKQEGTNESQEQYQLINKNVNRLFNLVNQLLNFRKIDKKKYKLNYAQVNIIELVREVFSGFTQLARQREINFVFRSNVSFYESYLDEEVVIKALSNLLTNAFKFTNRTIEVVVYVPAWQKNTPDDERYFQISVIDDGIGIAQKDHAAIFNPFFQVRERISESMGFTGTGLGLSFAKSLVELHNGKILVDSKPEKGARFTIQIPVIKKIAIEDQADILQYQTRNAVRSFILDEINDLFDDEHPPSQELVISSGNPDILIVEDNEDLREFLKRHFQHQYNITLAENGQTALNILKEQEFDLIISDILMPEMDGIDFCKQVKSNFDTSHIPIIIFSGKTTLDTKIISTETGADAFVDKPFSLKYLSVLIGNMIESRKTLKAKFSQQPFVRISDITSSRADKKFLGKIDDIIIANIDNTEFSTEDLARAVHVSRSSLHKKLKAIAGLTPNDYIKIIRLKKAAEYLRCGEYRINEVCDKVGFNTPSYFSKCFQEQFGVLPSEFGKVSV